MRAAAVSQPVILNHPAWAGFPVQPSPGYQASADNRQIVSFADQLLALIDNYILSLRPLAGRSREVQQMLNQTFQIKRRSNGDHAART